jgi:diacylglycerol kinase (ATP)
VKRCVVLVNDSAGRFRFRPSADDMRQMIHHLGLDLEVIGTRSERHMIQTLHDLVERKAERVAVAGGDGTASVAAQIVSGTDTALGIVPQGTANNFATALRLPMDLPSALRVLQDGEVRRVDLGRACGRTFCESAGVGLFADALSLYGVGSNKNGVRALYAIVRILLNLRAHRIEITLDGKCFEEPAIFCAAANSFRMGYALAIAPGARLTDGLLDVVILGDVRRNELWSYYRAMRSQLHTSLPKVEIAQCHEVRIDARRRLAVHCDDKVPCTTPVTITADPGALRVLLEAL